jgi:hypothetical protein
VNPGKVVSLIAPFEAEATRTLKAFCFFFVSLLSRVKERASGARCQTRQIEPKLISMVICAAKFVLIAVTLRK